MPSKVFGTLDLPRLGSSGCSRSQQVLAHKAATALSLFLKSCEAPVKLIGLGCELLCLSVKLPDLGP